MGRYIISTYKFAEHDSLDKAARELGRLQAKHPGKDFTVYQVRRVPPVAMVRVGDHDPEPVRS
jgi:hypothetical protein